MRLKDKVLIVTGGASGIGKSISIRAANEGAKVVAADIREDPLEGGENTVDAIINTGGDSTFMNTDVTDDKDVKKLVANTVKKYGFLDIIENYDGTQAAKLATYSAGMSYLNLKNYEKAIFFLDQFNSDDVLLSALSKASPIAPFERALRRTSSELN
jgi:NAD(P)-dependent dehydrogenase (short-subunit alcohol dehydrogenase family)